MENQAFDELFGRIDKDNSGSLDKKELGEFFIEHCKGEDKFDDMLKNEIARQIRVYQNQP
jgi:Ca2+-binding EF-hand superfamily protein